MQIRSVGDMLYAFTGRLIFGRQAMYLKYVNEVAQQFPKWREERLPPPRVNQSQVRRSILCSVQLRQIPGCSTIKLL